MEKVDIVAVYIEQDGKVLMVQEKGLSYFLNWELYNTQGEKYRRKKETIQKWKRLRILLG